MALLSPGVEVTITDQSQYLPAPTGSIPFFLVATAQNKANPNGTGVAVGTTAANANKLYTITSQRDLVTTYGTPFFYTTTNGTPIQGYELNEYGLLAAYSALGLCNQIYVLRSDIDLASLVGQTGRPSSAPDNGTYWLNTTNTDWGIYEYNSTTNTFTNKLPIVINDSNLISGGMPIPSLGQVGSYAVNAVVADSNNGLPTLNFQYFYKNSSNLWTKIGQVDWLRSWPVVEGTESNPTLTAGDILTIDVSGDFSFSITVPASPNNTVANMATLISAVTNEVSASVVSGKLRLFCNQRISDTTSVYYLETTTTGTLDTDLGIPDDIYNQPAMFLGTSAEQPLWSSSQTYPRPTGSVWIKIGASGIGYDPIISEFNSVTSSWDPKTVTLGINDWQVTNSIDPEGGLNIPAGTIYAQYSFNDNISWGPIYLFERLATGPAIFTGSDTSPTFTNGPYTSYVQVSLPSSSNLSNTYTVTLADNSDATDFVDAWILAGIPYTTVEVLDSGAIQISHTAGGVIIVDTVSATKTDNQMMIDAGFIIDTDSNIKIGEQVIVTYTNITQTSTSGSGTGATFSIQCPYGNYKVTSISNGGSGYVVGDTITIAGASLGGTTPGNNLTLKVMSVSTGAVTSVSIFGGAGANTTAMYKTQLSNWGYFTYTPNEGAPVGDPTNGTNWYYSVDNEVDIMVNYNGAWKGYKNQNYDNNGFPTPTGSNATDPNGPIISASEPTTQSDGTALVYGDLWIDTSDLENYPIINRWQLVDTEDKWVRIDNTDQTSGSGVLFADARWATNGTTNPVNDPIPTIISLLTSNYLDLDAPSSSSYPVGMLLFNTRRSGFNVKQFITNYFNNVRFPDETLPTEKDAWVTISGNQTNGSPYMGRKAQRAVVVQSLRSAIDTNLNIRDEDFFFNIISCPNYPELQPNMIVLNADRGETGFIVGDTPLRLADNATAIQAWATNAAGASSTGEEGLVSRSTYMGLFYPSGLTSDFNGNLVAVPPSHMMVRTLLRNDSIAYPWFAPAGTRRGVIDNATSIGYINSATGEFVTTRTRLGIRDVLYTNFINPLVFFTGQGLLNYGNKSSFNSQSALDRINVARLVAYIRRQLILLARPFIFEPNDAFTRSQVQNTVSALMNELVTLRGILDYSVICDDSNNTPARIDRSELWVDVAIQPVKAVEFIYIPVRILNTGESFNATT